METCICGVCKSTLPIMPFFFVTLPSMAYTFSVLLPFVQVDAFYVADGRLAVIEAEDVTVGLR